MLQPPSSAGELAARQDEISSVDLLLIATLNMSLQGWAAGAGSRAPSSVIQGSVKPRNYLGSACVTRAVVAPSSLVHLVTVQKIHG